MTRRILTGVLAVVTVLASTACGVRVDERVTTYNPSDLPPELVNETTTTTTTTTTTAPPTTIAPDATVGAPPTSSTMPLPETKPIQVFYHLGYTEQMQPFQVERVSPVPLSVLADLLESPIGINEYGLRSSVRFGLIDEVTLDRGVATIVLDAAVLGRMGNLELQRAIAQMVLTYTSFSTADVGAIGQVRFTVDDDEFSVYVPAFGGSSAPGEPLAFQDFASLISSSTTPATSAPTPTVTSTSTPTSTTDQ